MAINISNLLQEGESSYEDLFTSYSSVFNLFSSQRFIPLLRNSNYFIIYLGGNYLFIYKIQNTRSMHFTSILLSILRLRPKTFK